MNKVNFAQDIDPVLKNIDFSKLGNNVAIKVHFGEQGCNTYLDPELVRKVYQKIEDSGKKATLIECNVLYKGSRVNTASHIATALSHGFTDMDIDILDGEAGEDFVELDGCKIGAGIKKYDSLVVVSHFKGHMAAGFGGAIKNVGMGLGSRAGKLHMHSQVMPKILDDKCIGCGICADNCNADAITVQNRIAVIDEKKCEGCAMCIAVCPTGAASVPWQGGTHDRLQEMIAKYTKAVLDLFPDAIFLNVLKNITPLCDCMGQAQTPMMSDVGILSGTDIVAIDRASLDLADEYSHGKFSAINNVDKDKQIEFARLAGLGSQEYELVKL